jgi:hypothetical protein
LNMKIKNLGLKKQCLHNVDLWPLKSTNCDFYFWSFYFLLNQLKLRLSLPLYLLKNINIFFKLFLAVDNAVNGTKMISWIIANWFLKGEGSDFISPIMALLNAPKGWNLYRFSVTLKPSSSQSQLSTFLFSAPSYFLYWRKM